MWNFFMNFSAIFFVNLTVMYVWHKKGIKFFFFYIV